MKMAFEHSDFVFFYSIKILTFVNSKSSTLKSGAKWLNFKAKFKMKGQINLKIQI